MRNRVLASRALGVLALVSGCTSGKDTTGADRASASTTSTSTTPPPVDVSLDCAASRLEYVDGHGDGFGRAWAGQRTPEEALQRYVGFDEGSLPAGYVAVPQRDGAPPSVLFVHRAEDGTRTLRVQVVRLGGGWFAIGHARCD